MIQSVTWWNEIMGTPLRACISRNGLGELEVGPIIKQLEARSQKIRAPNDRILWNLSLSLHTDFAFSFFFFPLPKQMEMRVENV